MHNAQPCACTCASREAGHSPALHPVHEVLNGRSWPRLSTAEAALFARTAAWLDQTISRPDPRLGRGGDVCPWTRRTLQLGRLFLASIPATEDTCIDTSVLRLLAAFQDFGQQSGGLDTFRAIVAVFPRLAPATADRTIVAAHARLKPAFLRNRMMLGEFYPHCEKPGLHAPDFRPLRSPHPLLVIRAMVEADLAFLTDRDEFLEAYLNAFGEVGRQRLRELLEDPRGRVAPERLAQLRSRTPWPGPP
jgi:hypothetical protein